MPEFHGLYSIAAKDTFAIFGSAHFHNRMPDIKRAGHYAIPAPKAFVLAIKHSAFLSLCTHEHDMRHQLPITVVD
jgi:hypothetical protein